MAHTKAYDFTVAADGDDLVIRHGTATRFGANDDPEDNGVGAWGFPVRQHPEYLGISLPIRGHAGGLTDSPVPHLPGGIAVKVYSAKTGKSVFAHLVDIGPSRFTGRAADLMNSVVTALGLTLADGVYPVDLRVIGGAKYLPGHATESVADVSPDAEGGWAVCEEGVA